MCRCRRGDDGGNFNPRSPHGERRLRPSCQAHGQGISIHAPRTGSDASRKKYIPWALISIHAPRTGSDSGSRCGRSVAAVFQSTLPARGATFRDRAAPAPQSISIHAPRTGSDRKAARLAARPHGISIHAPRTGSDRHFSRFPAPAVLFQSTLPARGATDACFACAHSIRISIHAPRTGSDRARVTTSAKVFGFQSTLPARGATKMDAYINEDAEISIHAPRTGSDARHCGTRFSRRISIHAPRTGSDGGTSIPSEILMRFQSTLPARGATRIYQQGVMMVVFQSTLPARGATPSSNGLIWVQGISIHAPRTGSDTATASVPPNRRYFNPRSPHGERPERLLAKKATSGYFNPRSPHGERPKHGSTRIPGKNISIHAPRTGSDVLSDFGNNLEKAFQSTLPARGATKNTSGVDIDVQFQSTLPARGATRQEARRSCAPRYFNPRSPHGERRL